MKTVLLRRITLLVCLIALLSTAVSVGANWTWELSADRYRELNAFERAQYDKAADLFKKARNIPSYRAAAAEFEKFKVMFPDSVEVPYAVFMQGLSYHRARDRGKALRIYQEVLDYFKDDELVAPCALYFMGKAHEDNGDLRASLQCMEKMVSTELYSWHPLAADASLALAENHWKATEYEAAITRYKDIINKFEDTNKKAAEHAYFMIIGWYIDNRNYNGYENWYIGDTDGRSLTTSQNRYEAAQKAWGAAWNGFRGNRFPEERYPVSKKADKEEDMQAFIGYFASRKEYYARGGKEWYWYDRALNFLTYAYGGKDDKDLNNVVDDAIEFTKTELADRPADANKRYAWIADLLITSRKLDKARFVVSKMTEPAEAAWREYLIYSVEKNWKSAAQTLEAIEKMGDTVWAMKAQKARANLYIDKMGMYEEAIKLLNEINEPPWILWRKKDAYMKWKKPKDAISALGEIIAMFKDDAPRAARGTVEILAGMGEMKKAVAGARRLLKVYPKSPDASWAHQWLEGKGYETGIGNMDTIN